MGEVIRDDELAHEVGRNGKRRKIRGAFRDRQSLDKRRAEIFGTGDVAVGGAMKFLKGIVGVEGFSGDKAAVAKLLPDLRSVRGHGVIVIWTCSRRTRFAQDDLQSADALRARFPRYARDVKQEQSKGVAPRLRSG